ncbi:MAG TPA: hypothetical protein VMP12_02755 [Candidatus Sulfotelmatobacter sp.]|nr:hypothetical protein [Candidatus Sulfotelmatobacter sp.]
MTSPASVTVVVGQTATFSVTATGTGPFTYQWFENGTAIPGATSGTYTTSAAGAGQSGTVFTVVVTNSAGTATSGPATLTVMGPAAKSLVPSNARPPYGGTVMLVPTFTGGTATIGSTGVGSSDITANAVSGASYPTPALMAGKTYTLTVTDSKGNVVSTTCLVTPSAVALTPITPGTHSEAPGNVTFSSTATGGLTNGVTWTASAGTFVGNVWTSPNAAGTYTITATSVDNPSISVTTTTTVSGPVINTQPVAQHDCSGGALTLSVAANYAGSYQWNLNSTPISGATGATYVVANASSANAGNYTVTVTNGAGSVTSSVAAVEVGSTITSNPVGIALHPTQTATFSVVAQGLSPFTYQWYQIPSGGSTGTVIPGATSAVYTTPAVDVSYNGAKYYAAVTDSCAGTPLNSTNATLTVTAANVPPTIITQPTGLDVTVGASTGSFTVVATGSGTLSYQWYRIPAGQSVGSVVTGATTATYTLPTTATTITNDQDQYYVLVSNAYGQTISTKATLAVGAGILITQQPETAYVNEGDTATYTVAATSLLPLTYQWYSAPAGSSTFTAISGATNTTFTVSSAALADNGDVYKVVVSNGTSANVTSSTAGLFVGPLGQVPDLCDTNWNTIGSAITMSGCKYQLTASMGSQHGEIVWPTLIATDNIVLSFTVTLSNPSSTPADGFTVVLGDPSLGATPTSVGAIGFGLGAQGIPGLVFGYDTYHNAGDPPVPYVAVGRGETNLFENPWFLVNTNIPQLVSSSMPISHNYTVTLVQGVLTETLDGAVVMTGNVTPPPTAYLYVTASTGGSWETTVISNVSATVTQPPN